VPQIQVAPKETVAQRSHFNAHRGRDADGGEAAEMSLLDLQAYVR